MSFGNWCRVAVLALAMAAGAVWGGVGPSDCRGRDADSTCATAVAGSTEPPVTKLPDGLLYDGPLGGVPAAGYAYWGFDFVADRNGTRSPVRPDEFINRSRSPVTITLSFAVPTRASCDRDCLPGVQFRIDPRWDRIDPPYVRSADRVAMSATIGPGGGYSWIIGLWEGADPRIAVTVPKGSAATLADVGLVAGMAVADRVPPADRTCQCGDGTIAWCTDGERFSNGLLGAWSPGIDDYIRAGADTSCVAQH